MNVRWGLIGAGDIAHAPLVEDFVDAVLRGRDPRVGGYAKRTVEAIDEEIHVGSRPASRKASR